MRLFLPPNQAFEQLRLAIVLGKSSTHQASQAFLFLLFALSPPPTGRWSSCSSIPPGTMGGCCASKPQRTHDAAKEPVVVFEADTSAQAVQARPRSPALRHASTNKVGVSDDEPKHAVSSAAAAQQGTCPSTPLLLLLVFWRSWPERAMQYVFGAGVNPWPRVLFWFSPTCQIYTQARKPFF